MPGAGEESCHAGRRSGLRTYVSRETPAGSGRERRAGKLPYGLQHGIREVPVSRETQEANQMLARTRSPAHTAFGPNSAAEKGPAPSCGNIPVIIRYVPLARRDSRILLAKTGSVPHRGNGRRTWPDSGCCCDHDGGSRVVVASWPEITRQAAAEFAPAGKKDKGRILVLWPVSRAGRGQCPSRPVLRSSAALMCGRQRRSCAHGYCTLTALISVARLSPGCRRVDASRRPSTGSCGPSAPGRC